VLYSSRETSEWLCHDDSTKNIVVVIIIIIIIITVIQMAANAQRSNTNTATVCMDETTLVTEIAEGAGKCMPQIAKTREDTGRPACGPERSWPPDRVSSHTTMNMPPVNPDDLKARLYLFPTRQTAPNPTALCMSGATPSQIRKNAIAYQPWVEPLVRKLL